MSQTKRKSEYVKPVQSGINKSQFEKRTSVRDNRNASKERNVIAKRQDTPDEKIRQFLEDHSLNNQTDISKEHRETESTAVDQLTKETVITEPIEQQKPEVQKNSKMLMTPEKRGSQRADEPLLSAEKELSSEPRPSHISVIPINKENLEKLSSEDRVEINVSKSTPNKELDSGQDERMLKENETRVSPSNDESNQREDITQQAKEIDSHEENKLYNEKIQEKIISNQKPRANDNLANVTSQLRKAADRLTIKCFIGLRSLTSPPDCTVKSLHALLSLFSGVSSFVSSSILNQDVGWTVLKNYLQSPIYLVGQVQTFIESCQENRIPIDNIRKARALICAIEPSSTHDTEIFTTVTNYVLAAIEYYKEKFGIQNLHDYQPEQVENVSEVQKKTTSIKKANPSSVKKVPSPGSKSQLGRVSPMLAKRINETSEKIKASLGPTTPTKKLIKYVETKAVEDPSILDRIRDASNRSPQRSENLGNSRVSNGSQTTPKKRIAASNLAKNILRFPTSKLDKKLDQALEDKSHRISYANTARSLSPPRDQQLIAELTERAQIEEDTQNYKKIAREFRQMRAKLLIEESKKIRKEQIVQKEAELQYERELQMLDKKQLEEYLEKRKNEHQSYDLQIYEDRQESRKQMKILKKEIEEDYIYHELEQNLLKHYHKAEVQLDKKVERQKVLQNRLEKAQVDRALKKREKTVELEQRNQELEENKRKGLYWKKIDALNERIDAEREFRLLEKLLASRP